MKTNGKKLSRKNGRAGARKGSTDRRASASEVQTLHSSEIVIRRLVLNQPSSRFGQKLGWLRDTLSGEEYETIRASFLLWRRGRVYFENIADLMPRCRSNDGVRPAEEVRAPVGRACGEWDERGLFQPSCPLAAWQDGDGVRRPPPCRESLGLLGLSGDDGLPFWLSLKGASVRPARQFLSMCHARIQMQGARLFECAITVGSALVENQHGQFYVVRFSQPEWLAASDPRHRQLSEMLASLGTRRIEQTFEAEQQRQEPPKPAVA